MTDIDLTAALSAAEKACDVYGSGRNDEGDVVLSADDLDLIADAVKAAAPFIVAEGLRAAAEASHRLRTNAHMWLQDRADEYESGGA